VTTPKRAENTLAIIADKEVLVVKTRKARVFAII